LDATTSRRYYHRIADGMTQWERPVRPKEGEDESQGGISSAAKFTVELPSGWAEYTDAGSGAAYYHCAATGETRWRFPSGREEEGGGMEGRVEGKGEGEEENSKRLRGSTLTAAAKRTGGGRVLSVGGDAACASGVDKHVCEGKVDERDGLDDEDDGGAGALVAQGMTEEVLLGGHCQRVTCAAWIPKVESSEDGEQTVDEGSLITGGLDAEVHTYEFGRMSSSSRGRRGSHRSTHYFEPDRGMAVWSIATCPFDRGLLLVSAGMRHASLFR
jgi:hypothetical protein